MKISIPHNLGQDEATSRIRNLISETRPQWQGMVSDLQENWSGNNGTFSMKVMGKTINGTLAVQPNSADIDINLPLTLLPFSSKIETELSSRAHKLLT